MALWEIKPLDSPTPFAQTVSGLRYSFLLVGMVSTSTLRTISCNMAFPDGIDNGLCPRSHPIHLISIFYEVYFSVAPFNSLNDGGRFVLANGDPTGYGLHGDFMNGWDRSVLSRAITTCTADSGVIEDCPVFENEGRFYSDADMNTCSASNPLPAESVPGALYSHLPGCMEVTEGPGPASPENLVPGCVAPTARRSEPEWCDERVPEAELETRAFPRAGFSPPLACDIDVTENVPVCMYAYLARISVPVCERVRCRTTLVQSISSSLSLGTMYCQCPDWAIHNER
jgi:Domain of unknown function (DUF1996)